MPRVSTLLRQDAAWSAHAKEAVASVSIAPDGVTIAVATLDGTLTLHDASTGEARESALAHQGGVAQAAWSPDGTRLATAGTDGKARLWDAALAHEPIVLDAGASWVEQLAWSNDGRLATSAGRHARAWSRDGVLLRALPPARSTITGLAWSPDGADVLAASCYGGIDLHDLSRSLEATRHFGWRGSMLNLAWSPDARHLACGCQDASVHVWIAATGRDMEMTGYPAKVQHVAWDRKGALLATAGSPQCTVWDFRGAGPQGSVPTVLDMHEGHLSALAFQRTGDLLATGAHDGGLLVWDPAKPARPAAVLRDPEPEAAVTALAWTPDDSLLIAGDAAGRVLAWRMQAKRSAALPQHKRRARRQ